MDLTDCVRTQKYDLIESTLAQHSDIDEKELALALWSASHYKDTRITELLIQHGADVNYVFEDRFSALCAAIEHDLPEIVDLLIRNGANVNLQDESGNTPLFLAIDCEIDSASQMNASIETNISRILFESGANPNIKNESGLSPIDYAREGNHTEAVNLFMG